MLKNQNFIQNFMHPKYDFYLLYATYSN